MKENIYQLNYSLRENILASVELILGQRLLIWTIIFAYSILIIISVLLGDPIISILRAMEFILIILIIYVVIIRNDVVNLILRKDQKQMQLIIHEDNIELTNHINSIIFSKGEIYKVKETRHYYWIHFWSPRINIYIPKNNNNITAFASQMEKYIL